MDVVRMRANLDNATDAVTGAVMAAIDHLHARGRRRSDWTPVTTGSVDAAEHVANAILTGYGLSPRGSEVRRLCPRGWTRVGGRHHPGTID